MPELFLIALGGHARSLRLEEDPISLGRSPENALSFPEDGGLSRQHLVFEKEGDQWAVVNLKSKNGTFVNGNKIEEKHYLRLGDRINAGGVEMIYKDPAISEPTVMFEQPATEEPIMNTAAISLKHALSTAGPESSEAATVTDRPQVGAFWAFVRAGRELAIRRPLPELFRVILDLSMEAVGAERGILLTLDEGDRLVMQASSGGEFRISTTVRDRALKERISVLAHDVLEDEGLLASLTIVRQGVRSLMAVPMQTDDRVIGLVYVDSSQLGRRFDANDLNLLTVFANVASLRIERELWEAQRRLLISENVATLENLAAALSHELNNPLGALKSTMDTLVRVSARQESATPDEQPRLTALQANLHGTLEDSIGRMQQVIARMQRFTNLDRAEVQSVDLNELLGDVIALRDTPSEDQDVEVKFDSERLPPVVCRVQPLSGVFSNVLRNAMSACQQVSGRTGKIQVSTRARGGLVEAQIEDNGPGIAPEELGRIFVPGFRVVEGRMATGNWSLFSARQMIREQGGDIRIASEHGKGTTVVISLPSQPPDS
jgi:signal transduction histidine kinase